MNNKTNQTQSNVTVALLDSGVSLQHEALEALSVTQYNPKDNSFHQVDTGIGHGTGIFSLLAARKIKGKIEGMIPEADFLVCNALPNGQYNFHLALKCMNWLFNQKQVDVIINPWLVSEPGCKKEWVYPLRVLWSANSIPVFSAGNYGMSSTMNYSPANLSPFSDFTQKNYNAPLLSVGALDQKNIRLESSSYGMNHCSPERPLSTINAIASKITVAIPLTKTSYQLAEGTSYAVAYVGAAVAKLRQSYPDISSSQLVNTLLLAADDLGPSGVDQDYGYGKLNLSRAIKQIESIQN